MEHCVEHTGNKKYKPIHPKYFNNYYHEQQNIPCDVCGNIILKNIVQHKRTNNSRLTHFIQMDDLRLKTGETAQRY